MSHGLVVFDMDGTVLEHNSWVALHRAFGLTDEEDRVMLRWHSEGVTTYPEWSNLITRIYKARGLATKQRALEVFEQCMPHNAARSVVAEVRARGFDVALISGGIDILAERTARVLGIERHHANHRMVFDDEDRLVDLECRGEDEAFKVAALLECCSEIGIPPDACFCVGDGLNDGGLFALTGRGILVCPPEMSPPFDHYWQRVPDLNDVLQLLPERPGAP